MALPKRPPDARSSGKLRDWTPDDVAGWMEDVNDGLFQKYVDNALTANIAGSDLMNLTPADMKQKLGIKIPNHIITLCASIDRLKNRRGRKHSPRPNASGSYKVSLDDLLDIRMPSVAMDDGHIKSNSATYPYNTFTPPPAATRTKSLKQRSKHKKSKSKSTKHKKKDSGNSRSLKHAKSLYVTNYDSNKKTKKKNKDKLRSKTVINGGKRKVDAIALKHQLTEKNLKAKKQDKDFHKDLGKKLWPNETSKIVKEGWMKKRGIRRSGFKERWCELRGNGHLYYFEKRPFGIKNDLPQGMVDLGHVIKIEYVQDDDPNTFNLKTQDRDWIFSTMSGGQLVQWMSALNKTMQSVR